MHDTLRLSASKEMEEAGTEVQVLGAATHTLQSPSEKKPEQEIRHTLSTIWARAVLPLMVIVIVSKQWEPPAQDCLQPSAKGGSGTAMTGLLECLGRQSVANRDE